ncbi:type II toxin-antitoxin system VapC family toxin [Amycolatopsis sp. NPDC001319]|uniref:type II toxin-antitoxin system VapC family toxin n=1 Tax=unclassified Amycolatopsis TaxID=2618356 RepID=UPI0036896C1C
MAKYVIGPEVALRLAEEQGVVGHRLLAPTLIRSHALSALYAQVRRGELTKKDAAVWLDRVRALKIRLLGDRVLQATAWQVAEELGWADTYVAEYVALTRLHGDAFVTLDEQLARDLDGVVPVAGFEALS